MENHGADTLPVNSLSRKVKQPLKVDPPYSLDMPLPSIPSEGAVHQLHNRSDNSKVPPGRLSGSTFHHPTSRSDGGRFVRSGTKVGDILLHPTSMSDSGRFVSSGTKVGGILLHPTSRSDSGRFISSGTKVEDVLLHPTSRNDSETVSVQV